MPFVWWIMLITERIGKAWALMWQSFGVLRSYKALVVLPLLAGLFCFLGSVITVGGGALLFQLPLETPTLQSEVPLLNIMLDYPLGMQNAQRMALPTAEEERKVSERAWLCVLFFYLLNNVVITYFEVALASIAYCRFQGRAATLNDGLTVAWNRKLQVVQWACLASTVGVLIRMVRKQGRIGLWVARIIGAAWSLASFFAAPLIAMEGTGAGETMQRSSSLIFKRWGEAVSAQFSFGLLFLALSLPGTLAMVIAVQSAQFVNLTFGIVLIYWIVLTVLMSTAKQIFAVALYAYVQDDKVVKGFSRSDYTDAWGLTEASA